MARDPVEDSIYLLTLANKKEADFNLSCEGILWRYYDWSGHYSREGPSDPINHCTSRSHWLSRAIMSGTELPRFSLPSCTVVKLELWCSNVSHLVTNLFSVTCAVTDISVLWEKSEILERLDGWQIVAEDRWPLSTQMSFKMEVD